MIITEDWIKKHKVTHRGWTRNQIEAIGVLYPLKKGWIKSVVGKEISEENRFIFENKFIPKKYKEEDEIDWTEMPDKINGQNNYAKYRAYIDSFEWQQFRQYAFEQHGKFCNKCKKENIPLQVHHTTYIRLFKESIYDVEILCVSCHKKEHNIKRKKTHKNKLKNGKQHKRNRITKKD